MSGAISRNRSFMRSREEIVLSNAAAFNRCEIGTPLACSLPVENLRGFPSEG